MKATADTSLARNSIRAKQKSEILEKIKQCTDLWRRLRSRGDTRLSKTLMQNITELRIAFGKL